MKGNDDMKYILNTQTGFLHIENMCDYTFENKKEFESEKDAVVYQKKQKKSIYHCDRCYKKLDIIVSDYLSKI